MLPPRNRVLRVNDRPASRGAWYASSVRQYCVQALINVVSVSFGRPQAEEA